MRKIYLPFCLAILLVCCATPEYLSPEDLNKYIAEEENELTRKIKASDFAINVAFRPSDLLVYQEADELKIDSATYYSLQKKYGNYYYFILSLSKNNKEALNPSQNGLDQYSDLVQTLSFRMDQYVSLVTSAHDTIPTGEFMVNRTYGLSNATDILFAFNKEKTRDKEWVEFTLKEFGLGAGDQKFRFERERLEEVPKIHFEILSGKPD